MGDAGVKSSDEMDGARRRAAGLAARIDIHDVRLLKSSAELTGLPGSDPVLTYDLNSEASVEYEPGGGSFVVRSVYRLSISTAPKSSAETGSEGKCHAVAKIEFEQAALFVIDKSADSPPAPEELNAFAISTGQFALYPYAREYISDVTCRLGLPPLTLGVLRMPLADSGR